MPKVTKMTGRNRLDLGFRSDLNVMPPEPVQTLLTPSPAQEAKTPGTVTKIEAEPTATEKLKVAAYCRVSSLLENQEGSIQNQHEHYEAYIRSNPEWEYAGVFLEDGVTGTKAEIRPELQRLMEECRAGRVNLILTKSISRFSRNTTDCLMMVRELTALGAAIWFEKESIHTDSMESEFMLSIMACLAEEESRSISNNMKWGLRKRFQSGTYKVKEAPYGYRREGLKYIIIPEEAAVVRRIFTQCLEGDGIRRITAQLNKLGIKTRRGNAWTGTSVRNILRNVTYAGDLLYQKTFMDEGYKQQWNRGELDQYLNENHHPAIIPKKVFFQTQGEIMRRSKVKEEFPAGKARTFTGKLICPYCGTPLNRITKRGKVTWQCANQDGSGKKDNRSGCGCRYVSEKEAQEAVVAAINALPAFRDDLIRKQGALQSGELKRIDGLLERSKGQEAEIEERMTVIEEGDEAVFLEKQIEKLQSERDQLIAERAVYADQELQVRFLLELVDEMAGVNRRVTDDGTACTDYDDFIRRTQKHWDFVIVNGKAMRFTDDMVTRFVKRILVTEEGLEVQFKAGVTVKSEKKQAA